MTPYTVTIFVSAFLLFQVQPLIGKIILPWFGGSAAVWSAALLFFQTALLGGYAYAHWLIAYRRPRTQATVHGALLLASCALLPILPSPDWKPGDAGDPTLRILALLAASVGLPYFLLSSTSPLLQAWYARRTGSRMPYRLFALSNFGSLLALLSFPFVIEPYFASPAQAYGWSALYVVFALLCAYVAWSSCRSANVEPVDENVGSSVDLRPTGSRMLLWVALAACGSTMLIAITQHLTQNVAPIPLLWVLPLAIYLLTFILAFESARFYERGQFAIWLAFALGWVAWGVWADGADLHIRFAIPIFLFGLFIICLFCHGELAARRPPAKYLTQFYLMVALGGALGGVFVALIAPRFFETYLELPLGLIATAILAAIVLWPKGRGRGAWVARFGLGLGVASLALYLARKEEVDRAHSRVLARSFYGILSVRDEAEGTAWARRILRHGVIDHGSQRLNGSERYIPASYYGPGSGIGRAMAALRARGPMRYGVIGLGAGVMAGFARAGDTVRLYEINPDVPPIARQQFSFLSHAEELGADTEILMGDGRLILERETPQNFDLLAVDAFSGDSVPFHLLTREAFELYFRHLKPGGVLAVNVVNRYVGLVPVCARAAEHFGRLAMQISDGGNGGLYYETSWVLLTADRELFNSAEFAGADMAPATAVANFRGWTDRYSSLWSVLELR